MAMVRPSIKLEEPVRTTTKILNLYSKSADPGNKTGSVVVTTTIPGVSGAMDMDGGDFDASEITVIFEDEIETLYVGPVEISEEEQHQRMQEEAAAAAAAKEKENAVRGARAGTTRKGGATPLLLNTSASSSSTTGMGQSPKLGAAAKDSNGGGGAAAKQLSPAEATESTSNGSDSGIDNCLRDDNNKNRKNTSNSPTNKDLKVQAQKKLLESQKPVEMAIKKRGRPPGSGGAGQQAQKSPKLTTAEVKKAKQATTPVPKTTTVVKPPPPVATPPRPQYECELCDEVFTREDTIVDHYQSYHRVDPKKRTIQPRVIVAKVEDVAMMEEADPAEDIFLEVQQPVPSASGRKKQQDVHSTRKETKDKPPKSQGLICGKCNLTFRTILLLSRHVKAMHDRPDDDQPEEEEDDDDMEVKAEDDDPDYDEIAAAPPVVKRKTQSLLKTSLLRVKKEKENESPPDRPKRGRPRKSLAASPSPRILNADKGLGRVRMEANRDDDEEEEEDVEEEEEEVVETPKRGRKRRQVITATVDSDNETEVVPAVKAKRAKTARSTTSTVQVRTTEPDPLAVDKVIYVEVINEKDVVDYVHEGEEVEMAEDDEDGAEALSAVNGSDTTVYKIKERPKGERATDKDGDSKYKCKICDMTFTRRYSLGPHIQRVHKKLRTKECTYCDRKFLATGDLTRHMQIHTGEKPFECSIAGCAFRFVSRSDLAKHELRHTASVPKTYVCGTCDKSFERPYDLRRHQTTHKDMQVDFRSYKCEQCDREFTRRDEYRAHMYRHLGVKPLKCHVCGKPFVDMSNCSKHAKGHGPLTHHDDGTTYDPMECGDCGQRFTNQSALGRHVTKCFIERSARPVHTVPQLDYFEEDVK